MTWLEVASIAAGLAIGYWFVSVFTRRPDDDAADAGMPPPESDAQAYGCERSWHEVLDVSEWASDEEIAAAYRAKAAQYHPDKVAHLAPEFHSLAERRTREILDAWEALERDAD